MVSIGILPLNVSIFICSEQICAVMKTRSKFFDVIFNTSINRSPDIRKLGEIILVLDIFCDFTSCHSEDGSNFLEFLVTLHKMKFSIKDFLSKCDQIPRFLRIWLHLLKKSLTENFIF